MGKMPSQYVEQGWVRGVWAEDAYGSDICATDVDAARWCAIGAIEVSLDKNAITETQRLMMVMKLARNILGFTPDSVTAAQREIAVWNDDSERTQEEVVQALRNVETELAKAESTDDALVESAA